MQWVDINGWARKIGVTLGLTVLAGSAQLAAAERIYGPGVSDTEIKIGNTMPYSGPNSNVGSIGRTEAAYFEMLNEHGGVNGRKVTFISLDDAYSPPKTLEQVRKLVEQEHVLAIFGIIGTATSTAVQRYLNQLEVPQLFVQSGAARFAEPERFPWTMPITPGYADEARVYAKYIADTKPQAKIGVLYQRDGYGRAYLSGFEDGLGDSAAKMIVMEATYDAMDPTIESQVIALQASGADVLFTAAIPRIVAQVIRKVYDIGWRPLHITAYPGASIPTVLKPAGLEKSVGLISAAWSITPGDPRWKNDLDYQTYLAFMEQYYPGGEPDDVLNFYAYSWAYTLAHVLEQCGDDLTRQNLMYQATHMTKFRAPGLLPGISFNTSPTDYRPIEQFVLHRFDGEKWVPISGVIGVSVTN
ncbi:MAG TPA: ABC transporter substrate-binding protein [Stellaceae bacterium]|nr:ABC transporter substrate-binding protein [Stellaceae bacterium]